jgi:methionyl-tRNA synthetase
LPRDFDIFSPSTTHQPLAETRFGTGRPADVHFVGKEITRFHAVYWPAFLMSAGQKRQRGASVSGKPHAVM